MSSKPDAVIDYASVTATTTKTVEVAPAPSVPGVDGMNIRNLSEPQVFAFLNAINPHITRRAVRDAVLRSELVGVRHGNKNLFSRADALTWMNGEAA